MTVRPSHIDRLSTLRITYLARNVDMSVIKAFRSLALLWYEVDELDNLESGVFDDGEDRQVSSIVLSKAQQVGACVQYSKLRTKAMDLITMIKRHF